MQVQAIPFNQARLSFEIAKSFRREDFYLARAAVRISLYDGWHDFTAPMRNGINNRTQRKHRRAS